MQTTQIELAFADAMQQLDSGDRHGRAIEDLEEYGMDASPRNVEVA
ncbi:hypothetical protein [Variovorax sp. J22R115]